MTDEPITRRQKAKLAFDADAASVREIMTTPGGRHFVHRLLSAAGCFRSSFVAGDPYATAYNEGGRNLGLWALGQLQPDEYAQMMKEHDDG